jgi:hypothetical protein
VFDPVKNPDRLSEMSLLKRLAQLAIEEIKNAIDHTPLSNKSEIKRSIRFKLMPGKAVLQSEHPAFYLDVGVKPHKMIYLKNKIIPIDLKHLKARPTYKELSRGVAFRTIRESPDSPGYPGLHFIEKAIEKAQNRLVDEILDRFGKQ